MPTIQKVLYEDREYNLIIQSEAAWNAMTTEQQHEAAAKAIEGQRAIDTNAQTPPPTLAEQAQKMRDDDAFKVKLVADQCAQLDEIAKSNRDHAVRLAKANENSLGNWGAVWLEKNCNTAEEPIEKAVSSFMKSATDQVSKSFDEYESKLAAYKAANPKKSASKALTDFAATEEGRAAIKAHEDARTARSDGPISRFTKSATNEIDRLDAEIAKSVEAFSVQHNLDPTAARKRLELVSPTFAAISKRRADAVTDRMLALQKSRDAARFWLEAQDKRAANEAQADANEQAEKRRRGGMSATEKKFDDRITEIMKKQSLARPQATAWAIANDETARTLFEVTRDERMNGVRS